MIGIHQTKPSFDFFFFSFYKFLMFDSCVSIMPFIHMYIQEMIWRIRDTWTQRGWIMKWLIENKIVLHIYWTRWMVRIIFFHCLLLITIFIVWTKLNRWYVIGRAQQILARFAFNSIPNCFFFKSFGFFFFSLN